ncbi:MAG TPA: PadR family transcriptional regulator [Cryomorphaceae bacterium]|nr:PadR family transcriptional regulator [Cryomorphaceae bacterium]
MAGSQLLKGTLATIHLKLLADNGRMYGYEIIRNIRQLSNEQINITEGALYPALHKLEAQGFLEIELEQVDNRTRKYYKLSKKGERATVDKLEELQAFLQSISGILSPRLA